MIFTYECDVINVTRRKREVEILNFEFKMYQKAAAGGKSEPAANGTGK